MKVPQNSCDLEKSLLKTYKLFIMKCIIFSLIQKSSLSSALADKKGQSKRI